MVERNLLVRRFARILDLEPLLLELFAAMSPPTLPKASVEETPVPQASRSPVPRELVQAELERVLGSEAFRRASGLSGLLRFLVQEDLAGRSGDLKETYIGHHFFGRQASYDPKLDALVRVSANRLRVRLASLYEEEAEAAGVLRIDLPRGSYVPSYLWNSACPDRVAEEHETEAAADAAAIPGTAVTTPTILTLPEGVAVPVGAQRRRVWMAIAAVLLLTAGLATALRGRFWASNGSAASDTWEARPLTRLTGLQEFPDFSPDGRKVAFVEMPDGNADQSQIYVKNLQGGEPIQLTSGPGEHARPAWSPDGAEIAFVWLVGTTKQLRVLSLKTQQVRTVSTLEGSYPWLCQVPRLSWTGDGSRIVTTAGAGPGALCRITSVDVRTGRKEMLVRGQGDAVADVEPAVSPDGRRVAFLRNTGTMVGDLYTTNLQGGDLRRVTNDGADILGFSWDPDSDGFVFASRRQDGVMRLWHERLGSESPVRITDGLATVGFPAESPNGKQLAVSTYRNVQNIWRVWRTGEPAELLIADQGSNADAQSSPDGQQIVFRSDRTGSTEIWRSDRHGGDIRRLTYFNGPMASWPVWSSDGRTIAMMCRDRGHVDVCVMPAGGGAVRHVTDWTSNQERPAWAGTTLYFVSDHMGRREVFALEAGASTPVQVTHDGAMLALPLWSGGLLVGRDTPLPGLYCVAASPAGKVEAGCGEDGGPVLAIAPNAVEDTWAVAPGGAWLAQQTALKDGVMTTIAEYRWRTRQTTPLIRFPHELVLGDREMMVEPGGSSALVVEQGANGATLDLLQRGRRP